MKPDTETPKENGLTGVETMRVKYVLLKSYD